MKGILIVDDESDICAAVKKGLNRRNVNVSTFTDPVLALQHLRNEPQGFSVLITDVRMPKLSGFELAREAKKVNPKLKIVLMTAFDINKSEFGGVLPNTPIDAFLTKPVSIEKLTQLIADLN
jgi:two-component system response regulator ChvI